MFAVLHKGGPVMYALLACSIYGLYIIIEKYLFLKSFKFTEENLIDQIKDKLSKVGKQETIRFLNKQPNVLIQVLSTALLASDYDNQRTQDLLKEGILRAVPKFENNMPVLSGIITVAPILGLLGTVIGLIDIFNVISGGGIGDPTLLSSGIAQALITTVTGLSITIPFVIAYQFLQQRIERYLSLVEQMSYRLISFCKLNTIKS